MFDQVGFKFTYVGGIFVKVKTPIKCLKLNVPNDPP